MANDNFFPSVHINPEPVYEWQHCGEYNLLDLFYSDPKRYASSFQSKVLLTLLEQRPHSSVPTFTERSVMRYLHIL